MARTPDHTDGRETRAAIVRLTQDAHAAALLLAARCSRSWECDRRLTADECDRLDIDDRIALGDREAVYDAIGSAMTVLDQCRDEIGRLLADGTDALDRLAALRAGTTDQETAGSDASGTERARGIARTAGRRPPARHG
jgi:hypothetical protein